MAELNVQDALTAARNELAKETLERDVERFKSLLRQIESAESVLGNLKRELTDLEESISQGN